MRFPDPYYQIEREVATYFPELRPSQVSCLTLWIFGMLLSGSCLQTKVVAALSMWAKSDALRQRLREGLYDGEDRAAPCSTSLDVEVCWPALFAWVCRLWDGGRLPLALDPTFENQTLVSVSLSVLYRGGSVSVATVMLPANQKGEWLPDLLKILDAFGATAIPSEGAPGGGAPGGGKRPEVLVMTDRGIWSPALWAAFRRLGWHPIMRLQKTTAFRPWGSAHFRPAEAFVRGPGHRFVGRGTIYKKKTKQIEGTLIVYWEAGEAEPWVLLTDLPPEPGIVKWYALRYWIEAGFRTIKSYGWDWERTRRTDPKRAARHWLAMQMAMVWALAYGTRIEDADAAKVSPDRWRKPRPVVAPIRRNQSVFQRGLARLRIALLRGSLWKGLWLTPEPLPEPCYWICEVCHPIT